MILASAAGTKGQATEAALEVSVGRAGHRSGLSGRMSGPVTGTAPPVTVGLITLPVALAALSAAPSRMIPPVALTVMGFDQEAA